MKRWCLFILCVFCFVAAISAAYQFAKESNPQKFSSVGLASAEEGPRDYTRMFILIRERITHIRNRSDKNVAMEADDLIRDIVDTQVVAEECRQKVRGAYCEEKIANRAREISRKYMELIKKLPPGERYTG